MKLNQIHNTSTIVFLHQVKYIYKILYMYFNSNPTKILNIKTVVVLQKSIYLVSYYSK